MMHGYDYNGQGLAGHILSEKLDGCRAYWTGAQLITKSGRPYRNTPAPVLAELQAWGRALDCELCAPDAPRAQSLALATDAALRGRWAPELRLMAFDAPDIARSALVRRHALAALRGPFVRPLAWRLARDTAEALDWRDALLAAGREGAMAQDPASGYLPGRRECLLKLK